MGNVIYNVISKTLLDHCKDLGKPTAFLLGPTGISVINIDENTIHPGLGLKAGTQLLGLNNKSKAALRNRLSEMKLLIINELSMAPSDLWTDIDSSRLGGIFLMILEKACAGLSVMTSRTSSTTSSQRKTCIFTIF